MTDRGKKNTGRESLELQQRKSSWRKVRDI